MPVFTAKVTGAQQVWASPDGQRVINEVTLDVDGNPVKAKTYSKALSVGWSGQLESYEKDGKYGPETYVKQPAKEGGFGGGQRGGGRESDHFTMYLSYAKDIMVARIAAGHVSEKTEPSTIIDRVVTDAYLLYQARPGAEQKPAEPAKDEVHVVPDEPMDLKSLNDLFPE
jgi:hypothetical protein